MNISGIYKILLSIISIGGIIFFLGSSFFSSFFESVGAIIRESYSLLNNSAEPIVLAFITILIGLLVFSIYTIF